MSYATATPAIATRTEDLLFRAEDAYQALTDTWDANRAERLSVLVNRYAAVAAKLAEDLVPVSRPAWNARQVAIRANATRRQARVLARSLSDA